MRNEEPAAAAVDSVNKYCAESRRFRRRSPLCRRRRYWPTQPS